MEKQRDLPGATPAEVKIILLGILTECREMIEKSNSYEENYNDLESIARSIRNDEVNRIRWYEELYEEDLDFKVENHLRAAFKLGEKVGKYLVKKGYEVKGGIDDV